jgi:hypothetical protein
MMLHVMPTKRIHPQASKVNNIVVRDGKMYHSGELVDALDRHSALCEFAKFLTDLGPALVLVAHNGARFDFPRYRTVGVLFDVYSAFKQTIAAAAAAESLEYCRLWCQSGLLQSQGDAY